MSARPPAAAALALALLASVALGVACSGPHPRERLAARLGGGSWLGPAPGARQAAPNDCGPVALAWCLRRLGEHVESPAALGIPLGPRGCRFGDLARAARARGFRARLTHVDADSLPFRPAPAVLWLQAPGGGHFVAHAGSDRQGRIVVVDPALGRVAYSPAALRRHGSGPLLELLPAERRTP